MKPLRPERPLESVLDANRLFEAALGESAILLLEADLGPVFFDLRTGLAGELLQKFVNFRIPLAIVVSSPLKYGDRFKELVYEHRSHPVVRFFATEDSARAWLLAKADEHVTHPMNLVPIEQTGATGIDVGKLPAEASAILEATAGPTFQGQGVATAMAAKLLAIAGMADPAVIVAAQTLPERNGSHRVLEKHGFTCIGQIEHPEDGTVLEWQKVNLRVA